MDITFKPLEQMTFTQEVPFETKRHFLNLTRSPLDGKRSKSVDFCLLGMLESLSGFGIPPGSIPKCNRWFLYTSSFHLLSFMKVRRPVF